MLNTVRRSFVLLAIAAAASTALAAPPSPAKPASQAGMPANWPSKPLRILVGFPPGSTPDQVARTIAEPLSKALGQPVSVENKPGAGGNVAAAELVNATDNYTIGFLINGNMTIAKMLAPSTPFDPEKDLQPLSLVGTAPLLLVAPANAPGKNAQEFFFNARNAGDSWKYGSPGVGTVGHLGIELLRTKTNISPVHMPFPGNPQTVAALEANKVQMALLPPGIAIPQVKAGKLKAIGMTSLARSPLGPDYPTLNEEGIRGFQLEVWVAAAAPNSMPKPIAEKLAAMISEITRTPEVRGKLLTQGWEAAGTTPDGLAHRVNSDTAMLGGVILMRGIKAE
ncbi:tripartite tricarboxylate transporter substrate binding protein [Ramlibacter sp. G-1-2-2]|uniref:Tripartite tricarboxylate transporter substrate binding protein n=1 Tax=Ramlibacter agri TaxID=2728837 RepID=A0A848H5Q0_9BURK|nr:tripartite tricarboxylate transporter substrate binding protein [Ramlibacter agri]NML43903.1 tripartite tricarboxylate transporter substrate binding protein [Ramlibacter agri]